MFRIPVNNIFNFSSDFLRFLTKNYRGERLHQYSRRLNSDGFGLIIILNIISICFFRIVYRYLCVKILLPCNNSNVLQCKNEKKKSYYGYSI